MMKIALADGAGESFHVPAKIVPQLCLFRAQGWQSTIVRLAGHRYNYHRDDSGVDFCTVI